MFASIDSQQDIDIFLSPEEIDQLKSRTIEGTLIHIKNPKVQEKIVVSINKENSRLGIGVKSEDSGYCVYVSPESYHRFRENGDTGARYNTLGSKVNIIDESRADTQDVRCLDNLRFYFEHRDQLRT